MHQLATKTCINCNATMVNKGGDCVFLCPSCNYWGSTFIELRSQAPVESGLNESNRQQGLRALRKANFERILEILARHIDLNTAYLCDVGCSYGWFLDVVKDRNLKAVGIEPEQSVAMEGLKNGHNVRIGFFPSVLQQDEKFDVIIFNDVFEHLPSLKKIISECYAHLNERGILAINAPNSDGIIYRISYILACLGYRSPFERLWQKNYHCPHLHYFNANNLRSLVSSSGFSLLESTQLTTFGLKGLWNRLRMDSGISLLRAAAMYLLLVVSLPILRMFKSDIMLQVYNKKEFNVTNGPRKNRAWP